MKNILKNVYSLGIGIGITFGMYIGIPSIIGFTLLCVYAHDFCPFI
jgi:hypothetical protein